MKVLGDTHNFDSLRKVLLNFDNIISLGDIQAVELKEFLKKRKKYSLCWKAFMNKDFSNINEKDKEWFRKFNIEGWKKQINEIKNSNKKFTLCLGNSDLRMIEFFTECDELLKNAENKLFTVIRTPILKQFQDYQILFLPYSDKKLNINKLIKKFSDKKLFVLTHCPCFKEHKKKYYVNNYELLKDISKNYTKNIFFLHGHVHPEKSFKYFLKDFKNVTLLSPKANESNNGIGINNELFDLKSMKLTNLSGKKTKFYPLKKEYFEKDHWNKYH